MKYKNVILLVSFVISIIVSGFLYVGLTSYLENKVYNYQTNSGTICIYYCVTNSNFGNHSL